MSDLKYHQSHVNVQNVHFYLFLLDEIHLPFGYLTVRHGKIHHAINR